MDYNFTKHIFSKMLGQVLIAELWSLELSIFSSYNKTYSGYSLAKTTYTCTFFFKISILDRQNDVATMYFSFAKHVLQKCMVFKVELWVFEL